MDAAEEPPTLAPMTAGLVGMPPDPDGWVFEPKWDGVRAVARVWSGNVSLASRAGNDVTAGYPELAGLAAALAPHTAVLDGEIVAFDDNGRPSFERLQHRMHVRDPARTLVAAVPVLYVVFDLLWLEGESLLARPLSDRRERLEGLGVKGPSWLTSVRLSHAPDADLLDRCREVGIEGYMGKRADSTYLPGRRSRSWTKVKCVREREFVVGGWREGEGGRSGQIGALAIGYVDAGSPAPDGHPFALRYVGRVGSGLDDHLLRHFGAAVAELATETSPFVGAPPDPRLHFVRPTIVVQVRYAEVTSVGILRAPSLKGIRNDIAPGDVVWTEELG